MFIIPDNKRSNDNRMNNQRFWLMGLLLSALFFAGCKSVSLPPAAYLMTGNVHQKCLKVLREGLAADEFWPSIHAAEALIKANYVFEAKPVLAQRLARETDKRRIAGYARALITTGDVQTINHAIVNLQDILLSDDTEARILAAEAMFRTATVGDAAILEQAMDSLSNGRLRVFAAATLTLTDHANMREIVHKALRGDDPAARYIAADVIPIIGKREPNISMLLETRDLASSDFENLYFVRALAMFGVNSAREELSGFLNHPDPTIRSRAAFAIAEAWMIEQSDQLIQLLDDPSLAVRVRAAQALMTLSDATSPFRFLILR